MNRVTKAGCETDRTIAQHIRQTHTQHRNVVVKLAVTQTESAQVARRGRRAVTQRDPSPDISRHKTDGHIIGGIGRAEPVFCEAECLQFAAVRPGGQFQAPDSASTDRPFQQSQFVAVRVFHDFGVLNSTCQCWRETACQFCAGAPDFVVNLELPTGKFTSRRINCTANHSAQQLCIRAHQVVGNVFQSRQNRIQ